MRCAPPAHRGTGLRQDVGGAVVVVSPGREWPRSGPAPPRQDDWGVSREWAFPARRHCQCVMRVWIRTGLPLAPAFLPPVTEGVERVLPSPSDIRAGALGGRAPPGGPAPPSGGSAIAAESNHPVGRGAEWLPKRAQRHLVLRHLSTWRLFFLHLRVQLLLTASARLISPLKEGSLFKLCFQI